MIRCLPNRARDCYTILNNALVYTLYACVAIDIVVSNGYYLIQQMQSQVKCEHTVLNAVPGRNEGG